jgi:acyl carrier protein
MLKLVQDIVYNVTGKKHLTYETDFVKDLDLNSFDIMNIVCAFEDHFKMSVPTRDVWRLHQVKDVIAYIELRLASPAE